MSNELKDQNEEDKRVGRKRTLPGNHVALSFVVFALFIATMIYLGVQPGVRKWIQDPASLALLIRSYGAFAWLACIAIHVIQVVVFVIPGAVTEAAAGFVFGAPLGFVLALTGIILGSLLSFSVARWLGRPFVSRILKGKNSGKLDLFKFDQIMRSKKGQTAIFLGFLVPGVVPKDALCYVAGTTGISYRQFLVYSTAGRAPAVMLTVLMGEQLARHEYQNMVILVVVFMLFFFGILIGTRWGRKR